MLILIGLSAGCCPVDSYGQRICVHFKLFHITYVSLNAAKVLQVQSATDVFVGDEPLCVGYGTQHLGLKLFDNGDVGFEAVPQSCKIDIHTGWNLSLIHISTRQKERGGKNKTIMGVVKTRTR